MSALAALKGYHVQFLYSPYFILKHQNEKYKYHIEGIEDLNVLDGLGQTKHYIKTKNLSKPITLSDLFSEKGTLFIRHHLSHQGTSFPLLVSFGQISDKL